MNRSRQIHARNRVGRGQTICRTRGRAAPAQGATRETPYAHRRLRILRKICKESTRRNCRSESHCQNSYIAVPTEPAEQRQAVKEESGLSCYKACPVQCRCTLTGLAGDPHISVSVVPQLC